MAGSEPIDLTEPTHPHRAWMVLAGWSAVAAVMALILRTQARLPLPSALAGALMYFSVLGVLVWLACRADARFGLWRQTPMKAVGVHAAVGLMALTLWAATQAGLMRLFVGPDFWRLVIRRHMDVPVAHRGNNLRCRRWTWSHLPGIRTGTAPPAAGWGNWRLSRVKPNSGDQIATATAFPAQFSQFSARAHQA